MKILVITSTTTLYACVTSLSLIFSWECSQIILTFVFLSWYQSPASKRDFSFLLFDLWSTSVEDMRFYTTSHFLWYFFHPHAITIWVLCSNNIFYIKLQLSLSNRKTVNILKVYNPGVRYNAAMKNFTQFFFSFSFFVLLIMLVDSVWFLPKWCFQSHCPHYGWPNSSSRCHWRRHQEIRQHSPGSTSFYRGKSRGVVAASGWCSTHLL